MKSKNLILLMAALVSINISQTQAQSQETDRVEKTEKPQAPSQPSSGQNQDRKQKRNWQMGAGALAKPPELSGMQNSSQPGSTNQAGTTFGFGYSSGSGYGQGASAQPSSIQQNSPINQQPSISPSISPTPPNYYQGEQNLDPPAFPGLHQDSIIYQPMEPYRPPTDSVYYGTNPLPGDGPVTYVDEWGSRVLREESLGSSDRPTLKGSSGSDIKQDSQPKQPLTEISKPSVENQK